MPVWEMPLCKVCGEWMEMTGRAHKPLRRMYWCPDCGSTLSLLTRTRRPYHEHWRRW